MNNPPKDPFANLVLDAEEQEIEAAIERGEYIESSPQQLQKTKDMLQAAAQQRLLLNSSKPITLRINQLDLIKIKAKAKRNGIPYQTLLSALMHDFAEDKRTLTIK